MGDECQPLLRFYRPGDEAGLARLLRAVFPSWPKVEVDVAPEEHLRWKLASAQPPERYQVVAEAGGRIVGCRLFFLLPFWVRGERLFVREGFDLAVHPDCRGRGILSKMWAFARAHLDELNDFNFGVGEHPAALRMRATQGNIPIVNAVEVLVNELDASGSDAAPEPESGCEVREIERFDARTNVLFEEAARQFDFMVWRSHELLNWRYRDPRAGCFTVKQAEAGGHVLGHVVLRVSHGRGYIADLLAAPGERAAVRRLLREATAHFARAGVSSVECWLPVHHPYREDLAAAGFRHRKRTIPLSYRHLRTPAEQLSFLTEPRAAIHVMAGDTDLV